MPSTSRIHTPGSGIVAMFTLLLLSAPRANVKIGAMPLYAIDALILAMLYFALRSSPFPSERRPFANPVLIILALALMSEAATMLLSGGSGESAYIMGRTTLAISVFFSVGMLVRTPWDLERVLKASVTGMLLSASLMILTSLPITRPIVSDVFFTRKFLEPASGRILDDILLSTDAAMRGRSLIGVSILGATFVNVSWPLAALLAIWPYRIGYWRFAAILGCLIAPMAVLMSYSRGPMLGSLLVLLLFVVLQRHRFRTLFVVPVVVAGLLVTAVGVNSQYFYFERIANRTQAIFENPYEDEREWERILAYIEPFAHLTEQPSFAIIGEGVSPQRSGVDAMQSGKATHALFAKAYYSYGMLAALTYLFLIVSMLYYGLWHIVQRPNGLARHYSIVLFASVVAMLPWAAFGHAIVSMPRGTMMFFLIAGLLTTLRHFPIEKRAHKHMEYFGGDRRNLAFR